jgi:predicted ATPase
MSTLQSTGAALSVSYILAQLAEVYGKLSRQAEGLDLLAQALALVERTGERWYEAELHRLEGELRLQAERHAPNGQRNAKRGKRATAARATRSDRAAADARRSAEACFRTAMEIAGHQQAKSLELRAATSLSRLWQQQGKRRQAHQMLAAIYGWFSEGFETPDLRDARALLAELA